MRLVRFEHAGRVGVGVKVAGGVVPTSYADMIALISGEEQLREIAKAADSGAEVLKDVRVLAPIPHPGKMLFAGINYSSHADENPRGVLPQEPTFFSKLPSAVIGPGDAIVLPGPEHQVDYEVELAVVIGKTAYRVKADDALAYVFGYTVVNDVSSRYIQFKDNQITLGKGFNTFCPMGPEIVLKDEIPDLTKLTVMTHVNGQRRQYSGTDRMLFSPQLLVEAFSKHVTLYPGDLIATGTPAGVGRWQNPQVFLRDGDVVEVGVDAIGTLSNPVVNGW
ncbi:MAG: fumarylacetoacetate hydrolase family protein [Thermomicrobiales bacterium]